MSNINKLQEVRNIVLEDVLKSSISESLTNCDTNFKNIANAEYLRGATGESMFVQTVDLKKIGSTDLYKSDDAESSMTYKDIYDEIKTAINPDSNTQSGWDGNFGDAPYDQIHLIYKIREDGKKIIVSSLPFIYHDPRYGTPELLKDMNNVDLYDLSCTVYWQNGGFVKVQNFPTIYYDGEDFKWKIHGVETGLEAQGPKGEKGLDGEMYIVSINKLDENNPSFPNGGIKEITPGSPEESGEIYKAKEAGTYLVRAIMHLINENINDASQSAWEGVDETGDYKYLNGKQAFVYYTEIDNENNKSCSYAFSSTIKVSGNKPYIQFNKAASMPAGPFIMSLSTGLESIENNDNVSTVSGLFIPSSNSQYHVLYNDGDDGDLHIGKFNTYSGKLNMANAADSAKVIVDKNLEVNKNLKIGQDLIVDKGETTIAKLNITGETKANTLEVTGNTILKGATIEGLNVTGDTTLKGATIEGLNVTNGNISGTTTLNEAEVSALKVTDTATLGGSINIDTPQIKIEENGNIYLGKDGGENDPCNVYSITLQSLIQNQSMQNIKYAELVNSRNNGNLTPGKLYRITDYVTTTLQPGPTTTDRPFDIIVLALSNNKLSEEAWAIHSSRDTENYFKNSKLEAWQLWYCLDNDTKRFSWATASGKGVIYRMIDEFGNDCPYDFKNILFNGYRTFEYPYGNTYKDSSLNDNNNYVVMHNTITPYFINGKQQINNIRLVGSCSYNSLYNCFNCEITTGKYNTIYHHGSESNRLYINKLSNQFIFNGDILANNVYQSNQ